MQMNGATAVITGASRGLGFEIAKLYARQGVRLAVTARDAVALASAATSLSEFTEVHARPGDVADAAHAALLIADTAERFGGIDILINNASDLGPSPMLPLAQLPMEAYQRILAVNTVAPLHLTQLALPHLRRSRSGVIINVSSDAGVNAYPTWGGYGSSKAALEHWSHILAEEVKDSDLRVFVVDPGDMNTVMHELAEPGADLSHLPRPEAVAPAFVRLLADGRRYARLEAQELLAPAGAPV